MRLILAAAAAAVVAALGALILGEYPFEGVTVLASAVVFGLFIAETAIWAHRGPGRALAAVAAALGLGAMAWAAWITTGHDLSFLGPAGWAAVAVTGATAGIRAGWPRRAAGSPAPPAPAAPSEDSRP